MNCLTEELAKITGLPFDEVTSKFKMLYLENGGIILSNYTSIISFDESMIVVKNKNKILNIEGEKFNIKLLSSNEIIIKGSICKLYFT